MSLLVYYFCYLSVQCGAAHWWYIYSENNTLKKYLKIEVCRLK